MHPSSAAPPPRPAPPCLLTPAGFTRTDISVTTPGFSTASRYLVSGALGVICVGLAPSATYSTMQKVRKLGKVLEVKACLSYTPSAAAVPTALAAFSCRGTGVGKV